MQASEKPNCRCTSYNHKGSIKHGWRKPRQNALRYALGFHGKCGIFVVNKGKTEKITYNGHTPTQIVGICPKFCYLVQNQGNYGYYCVNIGFHYSPITTSTICFLPGKIGSTLPSIALPSMVTDFTPLLMPFGFFTEIS